jgi:hypothetical protein
MQAFDHNAADCNQTDDYMDPICCHKWLWQYFSIDNPLHQIILNDLDFKNYEVLLIWISLT